MTRYRGIASRVRAKLSPRCFGVMPSVSILDLFKFAFDSSTVTSRDCIRSISLAMTGFSSYLTG
ncbi:hypothetical protein HUT03_00065 [Candidatus Liberibacter africanus]|uniref:hypothetical protein n=1 Tax=Liberibacter africanus TaxID=34020 RepID=UPI0011DDB242|nr:hypothetical protein [Candidatus Liberibacter africanus]QTP63565.1 hypothetical protein HUT03_00065 [Candidatus Liberibacter africanus]